MTRQQQRRQQRQQQGLCVTCGQPCAATSIAYCAVHLKAIRRSIHRLREWQRGKCPHCRSWRHGTCPRCNWTCQCYTDPKWGKWLKTTTKEK